jgi:Na+(H+)/acetate symporter ActP
MSAASFLGIAGIFYLQGYFALAYVIGWTGGYVPLLILMAGQIRRFGKYTAPEFVEARYDPPVARVLSAVIAILISLVYCVAQYKDRAGLLLDVRLRLHALPVAGDGGRHLLPGRLGNPGPPATNSSTMRY